MQRQPVAQEHQAAACQKAQGGNNPPGLGELLGQGNARLQQRPEGRSQHHAGAKTQQRIQECLPDPQRKDHYSSAKGCDKPSHQRGQQRLQRVGEGQNAVHLNRLACNHSRYNVCSGAQQVQKTPASITEAGAAAAAAEIAHTTAWE